MAAAAPAPEIPAILNGKDDQNRPIFAVLVKRTYDVKPGQKCDRAEKPNPLLKMDEYYDEGDPDWATVKFESDLVPYKLATDVVVIGNAIAPGGVGVPRLDVFVEVAGRRKRLRVFGDRHCLYRSNAAPAFTEPEPFTELPIQYERAYGGRDIRSIPGQPFYYPRNHSGVGLALKNSKEAIEGLPLPNIEDPDDLLSPERVVVGEPERWHEQPLPDGLGWFQRTWYPRCSFTGAMPAYLGVDTVLREETLGLVPQGQVALSWQCKLPSFHPRFHSGASRGLVFPYLAGTETIRLTNLTPDGSLVFQLPGETPRIVLDIGLGESELEPILHTVCIRLDAMQVDLVWRGAHEYPGLEWLPEMKKLAAHVS